MKAVAEAIGVCRSQFHARAAGAPKPRGRGRKVEDDDLLPGLRRLVDQRPTYGYRRLAALLARERREAGLGPVNRKRPRTHSQPARPDAGTVHGPPGGAPPRRQDRRHGIQPARSPAGIWNGEKVRVAFVIDAYDRELIAHIPVTGAGISGSDVRDVMLAADEKRFGSERAPHPAEHLSDNGSCYTAADTRDFARPLGLVPRFTPVRSPESNGMGEAFVKTLKRDHVRITTRPDAATVLGLVPAWIDDYNTVHPHSALAMRSPVEFRSATNRSQTVR